MPSPPYTSSVSFLVDTSFDIFFFPYISLNGLTSDQGMQDYCEYAKGHVLWTRMT